MLKHQYGGILLCLLFMVTAFVYPNQEHVIWDKKPLKITLPIGQERLIEFPMRIEVDATQTGLTEQQLRILNNDGVLYLLAHEPFPEQRILVKTLDGSRTILLDLTSAYQASATKLNVVWPTIEGAESLPIPSREVQSSVQLMRWAVQQYFLPERLLTHPTDIVRTEMHTTRIVTIAPQSRVISNPQASWRQGHRYITVVEVRNMSDKPVKLEHSNLQGDWQMSLFYPAMILAPYREQSDSTMLFLLSYRPFTESLRK